MLFVELPAEDLRRHQDVQSTVSVKMGVLVFAQLLIAAAHDPLLVSDCCYGRKRGQDQLAVRMNLPTERRCNGRLFKVRSRCMILMVTREEENY
jgi:hypothetical protein